MSVRSYGLRSDLMLRSVAGTVTSHDDVVAVRTPSNPTFRWGNYLIFDRPPGPDDRERWIARFHELVGGPPDIGHVAITWDAPDGDEGHVHEFVRAGFERTRVWFMTAAELRDPRTRNTGYPIRRLAGDADFRALEELAIAQNAALPEGEREGAGHGAFVARQVADYRMMVESGLGHWYGAFDGPRLVSSLGMFVSRGIGRYQMVDTHPAYRRRGLAGTLVVLAGREALTTGGASTLVIAADADDVAKDLYRSVGFEPTETLTELTLIEATGPGDQ